MTKNERYERNQQIINDIKAGMTNAQITEKYGIAERTIQKILNGDNIKRITLLCATNNFSCFAYRTS